jgi:hypothetical protein
MGGDGFEGFNNAGWPTSISLSDVLVKQVKGLQVLRKEQQGMYLAIREPTPQK